MGCFHFKIAEVLKNVEFLPSEWVRSQHVQVEGFLAIPAVCRYDRHENMVQRAADPHTARSTYAHKNNKVAIQMACSRQFSVCTTGTNSHVPCMIFQSSLLPRSVVQGHTDPAQRKSLSL